MDAYLLLDTTGSMRSATRDMRDGIHGLIEDLASLPLDLKYGVGEYKDFPDHPYGWKHVQSPTDESSLVEAALAALAFTGGRDTPEAQLFALDQLAEPPGGPIGWRGGCKRVIVWIGDAPGHDPICSAVSRLDYDVTEASVTSKLVHEGIRVLAVSMDTNPRAPLGLDDNPIPKRSAYGSRCGPPGGRPGQATRISQASNGSCRLDIRPGHLASAISQELRKVAASVGQVQLVPTGEAAAHVSAIEPADGFGPLDLQATEQLVFDVSFRPVSGVLPPPDHLLRSLNVVADGAVVGGTFVSIGRPAKPSLSTSRSPESRNDARQERGRTMANVGSDEAVDRAGLTGRAAGTVWGVLSGAGVGSAAMPVVGTLVGAVAGGLLGGGAGEWLGRATLNLTSAVFRGTAAVAGAVGGAAAGSTESSDTAGGAKAEAK